MARDRITVHSTYLASALVALTGMIGQRKDVPDGGEPFKILPESRYLVQNRTPKRIKITADADTMDLAPLAERVVSGKRLAPFASLLRQPRQNHQIAVRPYVPVKRTTRAAGAAAVWGALAVLLGVCAYDLSENGTLRTGESFIAALSVGAVILAVLILSSVSEGRRRNVEDLASEVDGDSELGVGDAFFNGDDTFRRAKLRLTLLAVLFIGAVLPTVAIFVATDAKTFVSFDGGLRFTTNQQSRLVSRLIQATYVSVLSLFPALLYFQFDRQRVGTIQGKWVRAIFRMDQRMETMADVNARYGDELAEASTYSTNSVRFLGGRHSPIVVATILISLGWTLLVLRTDSFDFRLTDNGIFQLLVPTPSAATMAFLGAYFFGVYLILRGYFRGDLRPKVYNQITARLVTVVVLAYLINVLLVTNAVAMNKPVEPVWMLSFLAGVVPTIVLQRIGSLATSIGKRGADWCHVGPAFERAFATPRPLTAIDGVDLQEASRLESEGIPDVTSLARSDLVSVMINTRLPIERLVDWTDQAVLMLLLDADEGDKPDARLTELRKQGFRTASSVLELASPSRSVTSAAESRKQLAELCLSRGASANDAASSKDPASKPATGDGTNTASDSPAAPLTLELLADQIRRDPAMGRILQWYRSELANVADAWPTIYVPTPTETTMNGHPTVIVNVAVSTSN